MSTGKIELSVGAVKIAEEEIDAINNKISELDERVGNIEDDIEEINSSLDNMANEKGYVNILKYYNGMNFSNAITNAELENKNIFFPKGEYIIDSYIIKNSGVNWIGVEGTVFILDNTFNFKDGSNKGFVILNKSYLEGTTNVLDNFKIESIEFQYKYNLSEGLYLFGLVNTDNVIFSKCSFNSIGDKLPLHVFIDFKGNNQNTIIDGNKSTYNTHNDTNEGGTINFRNFTTLKSKNVTFINNNFIKLNGGDEIIWACANNGDIENIRIENNNLSCTSINKPLANGIYILQTDTENSGTNKIKNVTIKNNILDIENISYSCIKVGSDNTTLPSIDNVIIDSNIIKCSNGQQYSKGIDIINCKNDITINNILDLNNLNIGIKGLEKCSHNIIRGKTGTAIKGFKECSFNTIDVEGYGISNCVNVITNDIRCDFIEFGNKTRIKFINNLVDVKNSTSVIKCPNNANGDLTKAILYIEGNIFKNCGGNIVEDGHGGVILKDNIAYAEVGGYCVYQDTVKFAMNNTIISSTGEFNDTYAPITSSSDIPARTRATYPIGHIITSSINGDRYIKKTIGYDPSSWVKM